MKKGFTIVEVTILFTIFIIVALLIAPLSLDDTRQVKNTSRWKSVQSDFSNIFYAINTQRMDENISFKDAFEATIANDINSSAETYKITYMNGTFPSDTYRFNDFKTTGSGATLAYKLFDESKDGIIGKLMYDVNGKTGPNVWGKDVYGMNIYADRFEPFCKSDSIAVQKQDCSPNGTGLCCSNYSLIGGSFD